MEIDNKDKDISLPYAVNLIFASLLVSLFCCIYSFVIEKINNYVADKWFLLFLIPAGCYAIYLLKKYPMETPLLRVITTWISHFAGASVGKEGVGLMLGRKISSYFIDDNDEVCTSRAIGTASAFAALFVSPLAGVVFVYEIFKKDKGFKFRDIISALIASLTSCLFALYMGVHAFRFVKILPNDFNVNAIYMLAISIAAVFVITTGYKIALKKLENKINLEKLSHILPLSFLLLCLSALVFFLVGNRYSNSLSTQLLSSIGQQNSLKIIIIYVFAKLIFTQLSILSGFTGGEFVPLVIIGGYCGAAVCQIFQSASPLVLSVSAFSALAFGMNIPLTAITLEIELILFSLLGL